MDLRNTAIDFETIEALRQLIYDYLKKDDNSSSAAFDLEDVRSRITPPEVPLDERPKHRLPDVLLRRLLLSIKPGEPLEEALKYFIEAFHFRKCYHLVRTRLEDVIPVEFYQVAPFLCDGVDQKGNQLFIIRVKYYRKLPQFDVLIKNGFMYLMEQFDLQFERGDFAGATVVIDIQDFDWWTNYNFELVRFVFNGFYHYRGIVKSILIHRFPWALGWMLRLVESWIMAIRGYQHKTIHLIDEENIEQFIAADQRPDFLYGTRRKFRPPVPASALPIEEMFARVRQKTFGTKISEKNAQVITKYVRELVDQVEGGDDNKGDEGDEGDENGDNKVVTCVGDSNNNISGVDDAGEKHSVYKVEQVSYSA